MPHSNTNRVKTKQQRDMYTSERATVNGRRRITVTVSFLIATDRQSHAEIHIMAIQASKGQVLEETLEAKMK
jgi:hypothetical protein